MKRNLEREVVAFMGSDVVAFAREQAAAIAKDETSEAILAESIIGVLRAAFYSDPTFGGMKMLLDKAYRSVHLAEQRKTLADHARDIFEMKKNMSPEQRKEYDIAHNKSLEHWTKKNNTGEE